MKYRAVIFDLYGTLVDELRYPHTQEVKYQQWVSEAMAVLGVSLDGFVQVWSDTSRQRNIGEIRTSRAAFKLMCDTLNVRVSDKQFEKRRRDWLGVRQASSETPRRFPENFGMPPRWSV